MLKSSLVKTSFCFLLFLLYAAFAFSQDPFVTTWQVDTSLKITIPTVGVGYNYSVSWENTGDNTIRATVPNNTGAVILRLPKVGVYRVSIGGDFPRIYFNNGGDKSKLLTIEQWGDIAWTSMESAFEGCYSLTVPAKDAPDLSKVESMREMFLYCNALNSPIGHWNVSHVKDMSLMFCYANSFNQPIGNWDVSNVENMTLMFQSAGKFNQDIGNWNVSKVKNMYGLFYWPNVFNQDISRWDVSQVTDMSYMFLLNRAFNQDISGWNVSSVTRMNNMFNMANSFNQNLGAWDISKVTDMTEMLNKTGMSVSNYDSTLIAWSKKASLQKNVKLGAVNLDYCKGEAARQSLLSTHGWIIAGDSLKCVTTSYHEAQFSEQVSVSPNPFKERLYIEVSDNEPSLIELYDGTGAFVLSTVLNAQTKTLAVENYPSGVYFLKIQYKNRLQTKRLIKL